MVHNLYTRTILYLHAFTTLEPDMRQSMWTLQRPQVFEYTTAHTARRGNTPNTSFSYQLLETEKLYSRSRKPPARKLEI